MCLALDYSHSDLASELSPLFAELKKLVVKFEIILRFGVRGTRLWMFHWNSLFQRKRELAPIRSASFVLGLNRV